MGKRSSVDDLLAHPSVGVSRDQRPRGTCASGMSSMTAPTPDPASLPAVPPEVLASLLERVSAATGPDRDLDGKLWCLGEDFIYSHRSSMDEAIIYMRPGDKGVRRESDCPRYTASLDATLALVERVRPGFWLAINGNFHMNQWDAEVGQWKARAPTPALALLAALLRSLT
jgi:hypothetical protein